MQIFGAIRPLPPGVAIAAQRHLIDDEEVIIVISDDAFEEGELITKEKVQACFDLWLAAVNKLIADPAETAPVTVRTPLGLAS